MPNGQNHNQNMNTQDHTLEKLKIHERLMGVEKTLETQNAFILKIGRVIFGDDEDKEKPGMLQEVRGLTKLTKNVTGWLSKIFWVAMGCLVIQALPNFGAFIFNITHTKVGP